MPIDAKVSGFTLVELVVTLIIVGVLSITVIPRMFDRTPFEARGFADEMEAVLRYAQKVAIAQRRLVCVTLNPLVPAAALTLNIADTQAATACIQQLNVPSNQGNTLQMPDGVTFATTQSAFSFDGLGRPSSMVRITIPATDNAIAIVVEAETGYVHN